jgi:2-polyprenyl-3-methyl-5-hydroxy-6-metoxy-1,4-benzoquinol methylase
MMSSVKPIQPTARSLLPEIHFHQLFELPAWYWWHQHRIRVVLDQLELLEIINRDLCDLGGGSGGTLLQIVKMMRHSTRLMTRLKYFSLMDHDDRADVNFLAQQGIAWEFLDLNRPTAKRFGNFLLLDVLEHLDDPGKFSHWLYQSTQPGGVGIITVPAFRSFWSAWDVQLGHRNRFTLARLERIMKAAGFQVVFGSYIFSWTLIPAFFRKFWQSGNIEFPNVPSWLNEALDRLGRWEAALLRRHRKILVGTSAMAIVRK